MSGTTRILGGGSGGILDLPNLCDCEVPSHENILEGGGGLFVIGECSFGEVWCRCSPTMDCSG